MAAEEENGSAAAAAAAAGFSISHVRFWQVRIRGRDCLCISWTQNKAGKISTLEVLVENDFAAAGLASTNQVNFQQLMQRLLLLLLNQVKVR